MRSDLGPIDTTEEVEKYEAKSFSTKIEWRNCRHRNISYDKQKGELRCTCGVAFSGARLNELEKLLKVDKQKE